MAERKRKSLAAERTTKARRADAEDAPASAAAAAAGPAAGAAAAAAATDSEGAAAAAAAPPATTRLFGFGSNCFGQLGISSDVDEKKKPTLITTGKLGKQNIVAAAAGGMHSAAVVEGGEAYTWGCGDDSCLGRSLPDEDTEFFPGLAEGVQERIVNVAAGDSFTVLLSAHGNIYMTGTFRDSKGILGFSHAIEKQPKFTPVFGPRKGDEAAVSVVAGCNHVAILTSKGRVYTFGVGEQGQLGRIAASFVVHQEDGSGSERVTRARDKVAFLKDVSVGAAKEILTPKVVLARGMRKIAKLFAGSWTTIAIDTSGLVWGWGLNNFAQLGFKFETPDDMMVFTPRRLPHFESIHAVHFAFGQHHTLALTEDGRVFSVGRGDMGRLGLGSTDGATSPQLVQALHGHRVVEVACATCNSYAVTDTGAAYAWGFGENQQLATGSDEDALTPTLVTGKNIIGARVMHVYGGGQHTMLLAAVGGAPPAAKGGEEE